jgi:acetyltransferase-like isoleucine patch superfamily enzyme
MIFPGAYYSMQLLRSWIRLRFLRIVFGSRLQIGPSVGVRRGFIVNIPVADATLTIGRNCSFNNFCSLNVRHSVSIGDDCIVGEGVRFYDHDHVFRSPEIAIRDQGFVCEKIVVGDNCWLGSNVTVLKGVSVGANSIVGAGVILTKSIPPNSVVVARQNLEVRAKRAQPSGE